MKKADHADVGDNVGVFVSVRTASKFTHILKHKKKLINLLLCVEMSECTKVHVELEQPAQTAAMDGKTWSFSLVVSSV